MEQVAELFLELGLILGTASVLAYIMRRFKQPTILSYILTGVIFGPSVLNVIGAHEFIKVFSEFGVAFLLFTVGLQLSIRDLKEVGKVAFLTGIGQVLFTFTIAFLGLNVLGFDWKAAVYIAIALSFSSTIIVVKLLSEKNDISSLYGKIAIGFLLVQDFIAIFALIFLTGVAQQQPVGVIIINTIVKTVFLIGAIALFTKYILHRLFDRIARWHELLFISSLGLCFLLAYITHYFGLSLEIGSFLAGVSLATLKYNIDIVGRIKSVRDFFIIIFFVLLGLQLHISLSDIPLVIILSLFVLIGNPFIVMSIMSLMGYSTRTSLFAGFTVSQISEFSLIVAAMGLSLGHISEPTVSIITMVALVTITVSVYFIQFNEYIYGRIGKFLKFLERKKLVEHRSRLPKELRNHVVLFGHHRMGHTISKKLDELGYTIVIVDFDPDVISSLLKKGKNCMYGDMSDPEVLEKVNLKDAKLIISTVPSKNDNLVLLHNVKEVGSKAIIIVTAEQLLDAIELYRAGADYVIMPHFIGGEHVSLLLNKLVKNKKWREAAKQKHILQLLEHRRRGHEFNVKNIQWDLLSLLP
ncbi:MAG: cation:proton antiporter [Candidatus Diapherotrites archaeon]|nr:cation:proton antiporter [Candidatus Diapherotrites archaeon]